MIEKQEKANELTKQARTVWVVEKAATSGVFKVENGIVKWCDIYKAFRITVQSKPDAFGYSYMSWTLGTQAFLTKEEAVRASRRLIERKLACLEKQIAKLTEYNKNLEKLL